MFRRINFDRTQMQHLNGYQTLHFKNELSLKIDSEVGVKSLATQVIHIPEKGERGAS